jgi:hypothetical protein
MDAKAKGEFVAWLSVFKTQMGVLAMEAEGRGRVLLASAGSLAAAAQGAVKGSIDEPKGKATGDLRVAVGAGCALGQIDAAAGLVTAAQGSVQGSVSSVAEIMSVAKG